MSVCAQVKAPGNEAPHAGREAVQSAVWPIFQGAIMRVSLKLNAIEQEHLQELYDAAGVARDELPYSEQFDKLVQDFQDRTFKNAEPEQVFGALLKYVRSSTCAAGVGD